MDGLKDIFQKLTNVKELVQWAGYPGLALIVFSETGLLVGFFLPGDSLLVTAGLFAAAGYFNVTVLIFLLIAAAILGNTTGYLIGQKGGHALYVREESRFFKKKHLLKTKEFYEHYGPITIVMAQFMPFARTFAPCRGGYCRDEVYALRFFQHHRRCRLDHKYAADRIFSRIDDPGYRKKYQLCYRRRRFRFTAAGNH